VLHADSAAPHPNACAIIVEPGGNASVDDDRVCRGKTGIASADPQRAPRLDVVFCFCSAIKESRVAEGPRDRFCEFPICWPGLHPPAKVSSFGPKKKNTALRRVAANHPPLTNIGGNLGKPGVHTSSKGPAGETFYATAVKRRSSLRKNGYWRWWVTRYCAWEIGSMQVPSSRKSARS